MHVCTAYALADTSCAACALSWQVPCCVDTCACARADVHASAHVVLVAGLVQLMQHSYAKGAWNVLRSWQVLMMDDAAAV